MPKTGKHIYKRKDGRWEGRYVIGQVNGRTKYGSVYAASRKEVLEKLNKVTETAAWSRLPEKRAGTVSEISVRWLSEVGVDLKESTVVKYQDLLRCYILPALGDAELTEITNEELMEFVNELRTHGGKKNQGLAPSTVSEIVTMMNSLRLYAVKRDITVRFTTNCVSVKRCGQNIRVFSMSEERTLIGYLRKNLDL
ncbi:MAG: hypothetical protein IJT05_06045, partial [Lachnospiraceae bacterium]|nr:hypothetical protein [Lachnospiraceae bacterium]